MDHIRDEIRIEAPIDHVWAYLCDTSHMDDWEPRSKHSDWSGPLDRVGTTFVEKSKMMGFEMKSTNTVVEVEPLRLVHVRSDMGPTDMFFRFEPEGEATRLTVEGDYEMPGHLPGFIKSLMTKSWVERYTRHMLGDIKALAEATVPVPA
jgi:uncharacterized membrane protein